jgi:hypothetical protein
METFLVATHGNLAEVHLQRGDEGAAARHQEISLGLARELRTPIVVAFSLMIAARLVAVRDRPREAVVLQAKADGLLEARDYALYDEDEQVRSVLMTDAAQLLGADAYAAAVAEGRALTADAAADLAEGILTAVGSFSNIDGSP